MKIKISAALVIAATVFFFAAVYTAGTETDAVTETAAVSTGQEPGTRCTYLQWPRFSPKEIKAHKNRSAPGLRCSRMYSKRTAKILPNKPPAISRLAPAEAQGSDDTPWSLPSSGRFTFTTTAIDPDGDTMLYTYSVTGGRLSGDGPTSVWDLSGVAPGTYTITTEVDDGCGCIAFRSANAEVKPR